MVRLEINLIDWAIVSNLARATAKSRWEFSTSFALTTRLKILNTWANSAHAKMHLRTNKPIHIRAPPHTHTHTHTHTHAQLSALRSVRRPRLRVRWLECLHSTTPALGSAQAVDAVAVAVVLVWQRDCEMLGATMLVMKQRYRV